LKKPEIYLRRFIPGFFQECRIATGKLRSAYLPAHLARLVPSSLPPDYWQSDLWQLLWPWPGVTATTNDYSRTAA